MKRKILIEKGNIINAMWNDYATTSLKGVAKLQHDEMKKAFYTGCAALLDLQKSIIANTTLEEGADMLNSMEDEIINFFKYYGQIKC